MSVVSIEQCERIASDALHEIRGQFRRALDPFGAHDHAFRALDTALYVDQARSIAVSIGDPRSWTVRNGKHCLSTATPLDQATLALFVGKERYLSAETVFLILADIVSGLPQRAAETSIARFVNLAVVEPDLYPERDLAIWLTIAHRLATHQLDNDLHAALPGLSTDFDMFHRDLPRVGRDADKLRPRADAPTTLDAPPSLAEAVRPELSRMLSAATSGEERVGILAAHEAALRAYVREHLFGRLAQAVTTAGGAYAALHSNDDDPE